MSEEVKQEGEFKIKTPTKPKNLGKKNEVTKIEIPKEGVESQGEVIPEVTKVEIKNEDAVQTQETNDSNAIIEESKDSSDSEKVVEEVRTTEEAVESPLTLVDEEEVKETKQTVEKAVEETQQTSLQHITSIKVVTPFICSTHESFKASVNSDWLVTFMPLNPHASAIFA